ncbi:hypothetical protein EA462_09925 [Natrarchaeobius halalkaliphilus]|uniref:Uncharacterized protein n=1 Tax=Natrarchaeobius halalkaliphilus TaxID=1679091 RepID=A0A3N6M9R3_9EURY|nr:hypothetical protein [Natrarchaeobius halalkaliphilus]RQG90286.1 hypothetical protein EA462_09925 [Natrarchaeobius halalkaliphilus]
MRTGRTRTPEATAQRGQVYTLEGLTAAAVVLFALLFAMQAVVITPGTGGAVDRTAQAQNQQELQDALIVAAHADDGEGTLSELVRYWASESEFTARTFDEDFADQFVLGEILDSHLAGSGAGDRYGLEFVYLNESEPERTGVAGSTTTDPSAVTASYTVTIYEGQNMTTLENGAVEPIAENGAIDEEDSRLPPSESSSGPVYNVVEVRVTTW